MNGTRGFIFDLRIGLEERLLSYTITYLILFIVSGITAFGVYSQLEPAGSFILINPIRYGNIAQLALSIASALVPSALSLVTVYLSAHTVFVFPISCAVVIRQGLALGLCTKISAENGILGDCAAAVITLYFISSAAIIFFASYSAVYSRCFGRIHSAGDTLLGVSVAVEYIKMFLTVSGAVFLLNIAALSIQIK